VRRVSGTRRGEVTGDWSKWRNEELYSLYSSPNIISIIRTTTIRWAGSVTWGSDKCLQNSG
jgi:hypothetical protein